MKIINISARFLIVMLVASTPCLNAMQREQANGNHAPERTADEGAQTKKRLLEADNSDASQAELSAKKAKVRVPSLGAVAMPAAFHQVIELGIIKFLEKTCDKITDEYLICSVIDQIIACNEQRKAVNHHELRLELAAYCASKTHVLYGANSLENLDVLYGEKDFLVMLKKKCAFAAKALQIVDDVCKDPVFHDKAEFQPLTLLCVAEEKEGPLKIGYGHLKQIVERRLNPHELLHCLRQLIILDRQDMVIAYCGRPVHHSLVLNIWKWAELFGRQKVSAYIYETFKKTFHWASVLFIQPRCEKADEDGETDNTHITPYVERRLYEGDTEFLSAIHKSRTIHSGAYAFESDYQLKSDEDFYHEECPCVDLLKFAAELGYLKCAKLLLEKGFRVRVGHLLAAINFGHVEMVKLLLPHVFEHENSDHGFGTNFHHCWGRAVLFKHRDTLQLLLNTNRCAAQAFHSLLCCAIDCESEEMLDFLLENIDKIQDSDVEKFEHVRRAFLFAIGQHHTLPLVRCFIKHNVPLQGFCRATDQTTIFSQTHLLHSAIMYDAPLEIVKFLLESGVRDEKDHRGYTALDFARQKCEGRIFSTVQRPHPEQQAIVQLLEQYQHASS